MQVHQRSLRAAMAHAGVLATRDGDQSWPGKWRTRAMLSAETSEEIRSANAEHTVRGECAAPGHGVPSATRRARSRQPRHPRRSGQTRTAARLRPVTGRAPGPAGAGRQVSPMAPDLCDHRRPCQPAAGEPELHRQVSWTGGAYEVSDPPHLSTTPCSPGCRFRLDGYKDRDGIRVGAVGMDEPQFRLLMQLGQQRMGDWRHRRRPRPWRLGL